MAASAFLLIASFLLVLLLLARPLGSFLARLIEGEPLPTLRHVEATVWRCCGNDTAEMNWRQYALAILSFNLLGLALLFTLLMTQGSLPLNPQGFPGLSWDLAFNTAVSFVTNTNWQAYSGESTLSYLSQMAGLAVQNFLSAATGIAVAFALIRAFTRRSSATLGNAWLDIFRVTLYVLLPISLLIALFFVSQGTLQNFLPYLHTTTLEGAQQTLPMGPVASQEAIKMLGTNGGGFFGVNSAHPFENPTVLTNFVQMLAIFLIPCALCFAFGQVAGENRQGHALIWAMALIFVVAVIVVMSAELTGNPHLGELGSASNINMEGKESRFG
ncbi:MAG: potassium-transporting ATPase subunit KdpA, partial [Serratia inhibens]|uniref:potassium-transporting ATPase subunit KdpA n=1 Tax=Serratia inhibens TaxID=2338073 RepID=UPI003C7BA99D